MTSHNIPDERFTLLTGKSQFFNFFEKNNKIEKNKTYVNENISTVNKVYKETTHFNFTMSKKDIFCFDDSQARGEYFSLDLGVWEEINFSIDEHNRINVGRKNAGKEVRFFAHINEGGEIKESESLISFPRENYAEIRRVRGENIGLPLTVNTNGTVWAGDRFINMDLKIFTRRD